MALRSIAGLLLGLLLQVFLVAPAVPCLAAREKCQVQASACPCCQGKQDCSCASSSTEKQQQQPASEAPSSSTLKADLGMPLERISLERHAGILELTGLLPERSPPTVTGYSGVGLSISLCRLVV
jgi:hypothetical protein